MALNTAKCSRTLSETGRILGVDFGKRRIGLALTDPFRVIASPLTTLTRRAGRQPPWQDLLRIIKENEVAGIVVGLPLDLEGEEGEWAGEVRAFGDTLAERSGLPVHWVDERLSSVQAERAVRGSGLKKKQREQKERVDAAAASVILQHFLALGGGSATIYG